MTAPAGGLLERTDTDSVTERPWTAVLLNDGFNMIDYVIHKLQVILSCSKAVAEAHAKTADGPAQQAQIADGPEDKMTEIVAKLHAAGLRGRAERA